MENGVARTRFVIGASVVVLLLTACADNVVVIRLTRQTFPPKDSVDDVQVLDSMPARASLQLADLSLTDTDANPEKMERSILKKAASLGADAVVMARPESHRERRVAYSSPMYGGLGYPMGMGGFGCPGCPVSVGGFGYPMGMGWGSPWGMGYGSPWGMGMGSVPVPYDVTVTTVKGTAIRYTE